MTQRRAHRKLQRACLLAALATGSGIAAATPPPLPEELLEYLGSWESDDADWLVANAAAAVPSAGLANAPSATPVAAKQPATSTTTTTAAPRAAPAAPVTGAERKP